MNTLTVAGAAELYGISAGHFIIQPVLCRDARCFKIIPLSLNEIPLILRLPIIAGTGRMQVLFGSE